MHAPGPEPACASAYVGRRRRQHLRDPGGLADPAIGRELVVDLARDPLELLLRQSVPNAPRCHSRDEPAYVDGYSVRDDGDGDVGAAQLLRRTALLGGFDAAGQRLGAVGAKGRGECLSV